MPYYQKSTLMRNNNDIFLILTYKIVALSRYSKDYFLHKKNQIDIKLES